MKHKNYDSIVKDIEESFSNLPDEDKVENLNNLIHFLQFRLRIAELTHDERKDAYRQFSLNEAQRARLDKATSEKEFDRIVDEYARANYMHRCAWTDYFNGVRKDKPVVAKEKQ